LASGGTNRESENVKDEIEKSDRKKESGTGDSLRMTRKRKNSLTNSKIKALVSSPERFRSEQEHQEKGLAQNLNALPLTNSRGEGRRGSAKSTPGDSSAANMGGILLEKESTEGKKEKVRKS